MAESQQKQGFDLEEIFAGYEPDVRDGGEADPSLFILGELDEELRSKQRSSPTTTQSRSVDSPTEADAASNARRAPMPSGVGNTGIEEDAAGEEQEDNENQENQATWGGMSPEDRRTMIVISAMDKLVDKIEKIGTTPKEQDRRSRKPLQKIPTGTGKDKLPSIK